MNLHFLSNILNHPLEQPICDNIQLITLASLQLHFVSSSIHVLLTIDHDRQISHKCIMQGEKQNKMKNTFYVCIKVSIIVIIRFLRKTIKFYGKINRIKWEFPMNINNMIQNLNILMFLFDGKIFQRSTLLDWNLLEIFKTLIFSIYL